MRKKVSEYLNNTYIRTVVDERNEKIGRKIRDNEMKRIPYLLIVGEKESETESVAVRRQGEGDQGVVSMIEFKEMILKEVGSILAELYK